ncbi:MAG: DEAD/DEAH box helicase [Verrucomicrobia bacterium]|nr:DEAD/DEAH box helicase [Verrucomicrobiota bacterium]
MECEAEGLIAAGRVRDVEFSGTTYQVQVLDGEDELWPFIQLDEEGKVRDALCSCDTHERCVHIQAALLRLFQKGEPLHVRFGRSLWYALTKLFSHYEPEALEKVAPGTYVLKSLSQKQLFCISGNPKELQALIERRVRETEENSLKFHGLSYEELRLWREGRPSPALRYELSLWSDLAKSLMVRQDRGDRYFIEFAFSANGLPNRLKVFFDDLTLEFYLSEANLSHIIPALATVESPLQVHDLQDQALQSSTYDREAGALDIWPRLGVDIDKALRLEEEATLASHVRLGDWVYVAGEGFYSQEQHTLLEKSWVPAEELGQALDLHRRVIGKHLKGAKLHEQGVIPHYHLHFDPQWNLHIQTYLFDIGDLSQGDSRFFGSWVYLEDDGFYPVVEALFEEVEQVVKREEVPAFIHRHRAWLGTIEGFHTHLTAVESELSYRVDQEGALHFDVRMQLPEGSGVSCDFGEWIYIANQGFYLKSHGRGASPLRRGAVIVPGDIPLFIRLNKDELELVEGFFSEICPVKRIGLQVSLTAKGHISIKPKVELHKEFRKKEVRLYADFVYLEGKGFSQISPLMRLPERFVQPIVLKGQEMQLFLTYELLELEPYIVSCDPMLKKPKSVKLQLLDGKMSGSHVLLDLSYATEVGAVPIADVWNAIAQQRTHLFSPAGLFDLKDPRFQWLRSLPHERMKGKVRLTTLEFIRLSILETLEVPASVEGAETRALLEQFSSLQPVEAPDTSRLMSRLRLYQEMGVKWLWFLYSKGLSGLLCDDMGLGKTHQAMALLAAIFSHCPSPPRCLVVCPTSVLYHWREKLAQFLPSLRTCLFYGPDRTLETLEECDVLVTSYGVLRSEQEKLSKIPFELVIYDEVQVAKNGASQTHRALAKLQAKMRLGLTGTPIENSLRELKALFDLVLPSYLPSDRQFRDLFVLPIEREGNMARQELLRRVIRPFVLRRKKTEVLTELPEKTEEISHCDLSLQQRTLYNELLERSRERLIAQLQDTSGPTPYLHVFALLTALKQICDHPAVHLKEVSNYRQYSSGKWELFCELLSQARESKQKVVVFSQYLTMLDIIEKYLSEMGIGFAAIRGSTQHREKELKKFAEDPDCQVFVGSLQAVGLGVDLTAASVVVHYDRWWNAARENQATDRVHRLGQKRGVQVFKLLTLGTIEERIDHLIAKKGKLMEEVVGSDDQGQLKAFTRQELIELLAPLQAT